MNPPSNSSLEEIYSLIDLSKKLGLALTPEQEDKADELEEAIIKQTILPMLVDKIAPALSPIRRELVLVVDYTPGEPISVKLSRKRNIADVIEAKTIELDPTVAHKSYGPQVRPRDERADKYQLRVTMPNGRVVIQKRASATFAEVIKLIGIEKVRALGIINCKIPLISNQRDEKYGHAQKDVGNGWLLITHCNTKMKKQILDRISRELGLGLKVEVI